jgi:transposase
MGQQCRSESLFYYFRIEDHVPEHHLLRAIDRYVNFDFVREKLKALYSETGRPSIDPDRLLRILLIGYLYGVTSERKLIEELRMHLAWRWFTGLSFDQEVPHHSTFSKNRHGRFQESRIFEQLFHEIVAQCVACGLVKWEHLSVDGSFIQADASNSSRIPREHLSEVAEVNPSFLSHCQRAKSRAKALLSRLHTFCWFSTRSRTRGQRSVRDGGRCLCGLDDVQVCWGSRGTSALGPCLCKWPTPRRPPTSCRSSQGR